MQQIEKWFQIRKELYQNVQARVRQREGREPIDLKRYRRSFERELPRRWAPSVLDVLIEQFNEADLIFLSDFHALRQSQKTHLRLLKKANLERPLILAVECFETRHQRLLDAFIEGEVSEDDLIEKVRWNKSWGFPWENYAPVFRWARENKVRLFGLSIQRIGAQSMQSRDRHAARELHKIRKLHAESRVVVIFGDLHLSTSHLPRLLKTDSGRKLIVLQNLENIYFQILKKPSINTEVVRLGTEIFCILNVPPWVKWQSYLMFLEKKYDEELDEDIDFTDHVMSYAKIIANELDLKVSFSDLSVYTSSDGPLWSKIQLSCSLSEQFWIKTLIEEEIAFYLPTLHLGFLGRESVNQAASLAMNYIVCQTTGVANNHFSPSQDFQIWIWLRAWSYFGGKLINPKRKTDTIEDIKAKMTEKNGSVEREPLQLALSYRLYELTRIHSARRSRPRSRVRRKRSYLLAADLLGGMMGERLFHGYQTGKIRPKDLKSWLQISVESERFDEHYLGVVRILEKVPLPFKSKEEKI